MVAMDKVHVTVLDQSYVVSAGAMADTIHRMQIWRTARSSPGTSRMEARLVRL